jgi:hypothetical protein
MAIYLHTNSDGSKSEGAINSGMKEGIGAIAKYQLMLYAICKKFNLQFYNSGFVNIGHSTYTDFDEESWSDQFTRFFNFSTNKVIEKQIFFSDINQEFLTFIEENKNSLDDILIYIEPESILRYGQSIINEIYQNKYLIDLKHNFIFDKSYFSTDCLNISFHIRNINPEDNSLQDFRELYNKDNSNYINLIQQLKKVCLNEKVNLHIHSQGNQEDFEELLNYKEDNFEIILHLNDNPISDIYHMSHADLLIMAYSAFSWIAHLLNYNVTILRDSFCHSTYSNTLKLDRNYFFNTNRLKIKN